MRALIAVLAIAVSASAQSPKAVLQWAASESGGSVNIYRASSSCSNPFIKIATSVPASGPYSDGPLIPGGTYAYQVTAVVGGIESVPSNCVMLQIPALAPQAPAAPTSLTVTIQ